MSRDPRPRATRRIAELHDEVNRLEAVNARILALPSTPETVEAVAAAVDAVDLEWHDGTPLVMDRIRDLARAALDTVRALIQTGDTA